MKSNNNGALSFRKIALQERFIEFNGPQDKLQQFPELVCSFLIFSRHNFVFLSLFFFSRKEINQCVIHYLIKWNVFFGIGDEVDVVMLEAIDVKIVIFLQLASILQINEYFGHI